MSKSIDDVVHCLFRWSQVAYDPSQGDIINGDKLRRDAKNAHAELSRLRTENEALREALQGILLCPAILDDLNGDAATNDAVAKARAALSKALGEGHSDNG